MSAPKNVSITAGVSAGLVGLSYVAVKALARADRKKHKINGDLTALASAALAERENVRTTTISTLDGGSMFIREAGLVSNPPIVLLHGVTLAGSIWNSQLVELQDSFHVVAPDWRGHGQSVAGRNGFGLELLANDLATLLERLDLHNAIIVGHSMGGMALMHFCADFPLVLKQRVAALVFQSTAANRVASGPATAPLKLGQFLAKQRPDVAGRLAQVPGDLGYVSARLGFGKNPSPIWVEQTRILLDNMAPVPLAKSVLSLLSHDRLESLRFVTTPALVLVGSNDVVTPPKQSKDIADALPNAHLQIFGGAGHTLMLERSAELSNIFRNFSRLSVEDRLRKRRTVAPRTS
jgi:pimeloyl-ACP methyl ester carboxylesterase